MVGLGEGLGCNRSPPGSELTVADHASLRSGTGRLRWDERTRQDVRALRSLSGCGLKLTQRNAKSSELVRGQPPEVP
jgi:hypothetical protein